MMKGSLKDFVEAKTPFGFLAQYRKRKRLIKKLKTWKATGSILPMPHLGKQLVIQEYLKKFSSAIFIETGTYKGDMIYAMLPNFQEIYSIELDETLCRKAQKKFAWHNNVHIMQGQSGELLPGILNDIKQPCLFWLDAHYSGGATTKGDLETPIMQELQCILNHTMMKNHVLLIDDARCFNGKNSYPSLAALEKFIYEIQHDLSFDVKDDIIRVHFKQEVKGG